MALDIKTGKDVWPDTALQLGTYSGAEFIWQPPADSELPQYWEAFKRLSLDIARGENFRDYAPRARKWSEDAKKKAYATLDDLYWEEFGQYDGHRPMPEGLRTDLGVVVLLHEDSCELIPLKLDGALDVIGGLCTVWGWNQRGRDVVGEPMAPGTLTMRSSLVERIQGLSSLDLEKFATLWPTGVPTLKASDDHTIEQLQAIDRVLSTI